MTKAETRAELLSCLREIQEASGREMPAVTDELRPLVDLPGFESLNAEQVALELEERLRCEISHHAKLFFDEERHLTLAEMVDRLCRIAGSKAER